MDEGSELKQAKWLLAVVVIFLVSLYFAWRKIKYLVFSDEAQATVVSAELVEERGRRGRRSEKLEVKYTFADAAGVQRRESTRTSPNESFVRGDVVDVWYFEADEDEVGEWSRLAGTNWWPIVIVLVCLSLATWQVLRLLKEAGDYGR